MKKSLVLAVFAVAMMFVSGCRSQFVTVNVYPEDATVIANGVEYKNTSPFFIEVPTGKQLALTAYKKGYKDSIYVIDYELSTYGKISAWTSILVLPAFGLFADQAWTLKENNVTLTLDKICDIPEKDMPRTALPVYVPEDKRNEGINSSDLDQTTDPNARVIFESL